VSHRTSGDHVATDGSVIAFVNEDRLCRHRTLRYQSYWFVQYKSFLAVATCWARRINAALGSDARRFAKPICGGRVYNSYSPVLAERTQGTFRLATRRIEFMKRWKYTGSGRG